MEKEINEEIINEDNFEYKDVEINMMDKESITDLKLDSDFQNPKKYDFVSDFIFTHDMELKAKELVENDNSKLEDRFLNLQQRNWDKFYKHNTTNFFKDRHYILAEFPELEKDERDKIIFLDIGCGVGNSFYPLIEKKENIIVKGFDISLKAVNMAKTHKLYDEKRVNLLDLDIVTKDIPIEFQKADYSILMFVLSAIMPIYHESVLMKIYNALNDNGILYFRDYGRYDMAQIRFAKKNKSKIDDNLYMRHDKTLAFFFDKSEIENLFIKIGFKIVESKMICRMIKNRKENLEMHRLWLQIKLIKRKSGES